MPKSGSLLRDVGEFELIDFLAMDTRSGEGVIVGIGDDAAAFEVPAGRAVVATCDSQIEDVHFKKNALEPQDIGWRSVAVNLSDLAAMGAEPHFLIISLALTASLELSWIRAVYSGVEAINREFAVSTVGGNVSRTSGPIVIDVTAIGSCEPSNLRRRSGARPGDCVMVTGEAGRSALGLALMRLPESERAAVDEPFVRAHSRPTPRCREGRLAATSGLVNAMIDVSDGVLADLGHICTGSHVGAEIEVDELPVDGQFVDAAARIGRDPVELVLNGGEDYELLMAVPPSNVEHLQSSFRQSNLIPPYRIGTFLETLGLAIMSRPDLAEKAGGFTHF